MNFTAFIYDKGIKNKYKLPIYKKEHSDDLKNDCGATSIPINFFVQNRNNVFQNNFAENHALE